MLEVAKDKLESMVTVENINSLHSDSLYKFTFDVEGEYEKNSVEVKTKFTLNDTSVNDVEYDVLADAFLIDGSYVAELPLSKFDIYQDKRFDVELSIGFIPNISQQTLNNWEIIFGSMKIASTIEKNISDKVSRDGSFTMKRNLDAPITPVPMEGQKTDFFVIFDKKRYTVLKGLVWEIPVTIGGVFSNKDFEVSVTGGNDMISNLNQGTPRTTLIGVAANNGGSIEVTGIRKRDSKVVNAKTKIVVVEPQWASPPDMSEIYTGEKYKFDLRVKSLSRDRVSVRLSGSLQKAPKNFDNSEISVGPYKETGDLKLETLVDGTVLKNLIYSIEVKKLPPPSITYKRRPGTNELTLEVITYGKNNAVDKVFPIGGISGKPFEIDSRKYGNRRVTRYRFEISRHAFGSIQSVKIKIKDSNGLMRDSENEFEYFE